MNLKKKAGLALALAAVFTTGGANLALANVTISSGDGGAVTAGANTGDYLQTGTESSVLTDTTVAVTLPASTAVTVAKGQIQALGKTAADAYASEFTITGTAEATSVVNLNGGSGNIAVNGAGEAIDLTVATATLNLNDSGTLSDGDNDVETNAVLKLSGADVTANVRGDYAIDSVVMDNAGGILNIVGAETGKTANLGVAYLNATAAASITVGSAAAGSGILTAKQADLAGAMIFADPAFGDAFGDGTSYVNLDGWGTDLLNPTNVIDGVLVAGRNSVITLGGTSNAWANGVITNILKTTDLVWGQDITAAIGIASSHIVDDTSGAILVNGALTAAPSNNKTASTANFANNSLAIFDLSNGGATIGGNASTMIDAVNIGGFTGDVAFGATEVVGNAYVYFDNAKTGQYTILDNLTALKIGDNGADALLGTQGEGKLEDVITTKNAIVGTYWTGDNLMMSSELLGGQLYMVHDGTAEDMVLRVTFKDNVDEVYPLLSTSMGRMVGDVYEDAKNNTYFSRADKTNTYKADEAGIAFVSRLTDNSFMPNHAEAAAALEGAAQIAVAAGVPAITSNVVTKLSTLVVDHANMLNATQPAYGNEAGALGLWVTPFYGMSDVDGIEAGAFEAGYDMSYAGAAFGVDYNLTDAFRLGLALNVGGGDTESQGDFSNTENDFDFFGVSLYGSYSNGAFGLTADLGYTGVDNDITQDLNSGMNMGGIKSTVDSDAVTLGLTGQYRFTTAGNFNITPHAGIRFTQINTDDADVKAGGNSIMGVATDDQTLFQVPLGVEFSSNIATDGGWTITPSVDLGAVFTAGDTDVDSRMRLAGTNYGGALTANDVVDSVAFTGKLGIKAGMDNGLSLGLDYGILAGGNQTDHQFSGMLRYEF